MAGPSSSTTPLAAPAKGKGRGKPKSTARDFGFCKSAAASGASGGEGSLWVRSPAVLERGKPVGGGIEVGHCELAKQAALPLGSASVEVLVNLVSCVSRCFAVCGLDVIWGPGDEPGAFPTPERDRARSPWTSERGDGTNCSPRNPVILVRPGEVEGVVLPGFC